MNRTTFTRSLSALAAAVAISAAFAVPATAGATGHAAGGGGGQGKVNVHDISMATSVERSAHAGGANFVMADGSVRFDAYGGFLGGVVVATGDTNAVSGRITGLAIDPSDPMATGTGLGSVTDMVIDPFEPMR